MCAFTTIPKSLQHREGHFLYRFNVTVADRGNPPLVTVALMHVRTENVNDEAPVFVPTAEYSASACSQYISLNGRVICRLPKTRWAALPCCKCRPLTRTGTKSPMCLWIPTGKRVFRTRFSRLIRTRVVKAIYSKKKTKSPIAGLIRLRLDVRPEQLLSLEAPYNLSVLARDDGSCCARKGNVGQLRHTARALVRLSVADVNNNKPEFPHCADYSRMARIEEGQYRVNASPILRAEAIDQVQEFWP